jgi:hypothetical protein
MVKYVVQIESKSGASWASKGIFTKRESAEKQKRELIAHAKRTKATGFKRAYVRTVKSRPRAQGFGLSSTLARPGKIKWF